MSSSTPPPYDPDEVDVEIVADIDGGNAVDMPLGDLYDHNSRCINPDSCPLKLVLHELVDGQTRLPQDVRDQMNAFIDADTHALG